MISTFGLGSGSRHTYPLFERMPPVSNLKVTTNFHADMASLLFFDRLVIDAETAERITLGEYWNQYEDIASTFRVLMAEGFLDVVDYERIVDTSEVDIGLLVREEMSRLDRWIEPLLESTRIWEAFVRTLHPKIERDFRFHSRVLDEVQVAYAAHGHPQDSASILEEIVGTLLFEDVVEWHLRYVYSHLVVAQEYSCAIEDWPDMRPLYEAVIGATDDPRSSEGEGVAKLRQLFDVGVPELRPDSPRQLIAILRDRRVVELRDRVSRAVSEGTEFDDEFGRRALIEVLKNEQRLESRRRLTGLAASSAGLVPKFGLAALPVHEAIDRGLSRRARRDANWLLVLVDHAT